MANSMRLVGAAAVALYSVSIASAQTIKFDKPFQCNGERLIITGCFDDSNSSNCTVVYPDRPKTGGVEQMKIELRGDVIKRIKTCVGPGATLASVTAALGHSAPSPATATPRPRSFHHPELDLSITGPLV